MFVERNRTVFENRSKSRIQRLLIEWTKVNEKCQKWRSMENIQMRHFEQFSIVVEIPQGYKFLRSTMFEKTNVSLDFTLMKVQSDFPTL